MIDLYLKIKKSIYMFTKNMATEQSCVKNHKALYGDLRIG